MRFLLDTHTLLWFSEGNAELSPRARSAIESPDNTVFVSVVSFWEIVIKKAIGKLTLPVALSEWLRDAIDPYAFDFLGVERSHLERLDRMGFPDPNHKDPFDRMLVAQSLASSLIFVTRDRSLGGYGVQLLW